MPAARILVVDDEEWNRDLCSRRLERSGFLVRSAESGAAALAALRSDEYDLLLLDHMMPEMSGFEVLRHLRQDGGSQDLSIIMLTAETSGAKIAEALEAGADDYITKPVDYPAALARIRTQLTRQRASRALRRREERLSLASRSAPGGMWEWDFRSGSVYYSPQWKWMLGYEEEGIGSDPGEWTDRIHPGERPAFQQALEDHLAGRCSVLDCEQRMRMRDGSYRWMAVRGTSERDACGEPLRMAGVLLDIHEKATLDPLTGLWNRAAWMGELEQRAAAAPHPSLAVMLLNLDRFRTINESLGHAAGDQLLIEIASRLRAVGAAALVAQPSTAVIVARTDGDDFAVLVEWNPGDASFQDAGLPALQRLAAQLLAAVRHPCTLGGRQVTCTASLGLALTGRPEPPAGCSGRLLQQAGDALRTAKSRGSNGYALYDERMAAALPCRHVLLENELRNAIENDHIVVFYQPRIRIADGVICGFEALARWRHPERGIIAPAEFIPVAEKTGLIVELGRSVLRQSCRQMAAWQRMFPGYLCLDMAVNLSVRQCQEPGVVESVATILSDAELAPCCLHLELTESMLLSNLEDGRKVLLALKALGVGLKIDDFGTGYSSLRYLYELPFDTLKIDRSFILELGRQNEAAGEMVRMILAMAKNLHLDAIAEGVESCAQLDELRSLGCDYAQGYYFSRPVAPEEIELMLRGPFGESTLPGGQPGSSEARRRFAAWDEWNHRPAAAVAGPMTLLQQASVLGNSQPAE